MWIEIDTDEQYPVYVSTESPEANEWNRYRRVQVSKAFWKELQRVESEYYAMQAKLRELLEAVPLPDQGPR